jgi:hypothetical protein
MRGVQTDCCVEHFKSGYCLDQRHATCWFCELDICGLLKVGLHADLEVVAFFVIQERGFPSCMLCFLLVLVIQLKD